MEGRWISRAADDNVSSAAISHEGAEWRATLSIWCPAGECDWLDVSLTIGRTDADGQPLEATANRDGIRLTLRLDANGLAIDSTLATRGSAAPPARTSRLVRPEEPPVLDEHLSRTRRVASTLFAEAFGRSVPAPAVFDDPTNGGCTGERHLTATAYLRAGDRASLLYSLYITPDGALMRRSRQAVLTPAGSFRILTILVRYDETVGDDGGRLWTAAQEHVNRQHADFAKRIGRESPLVEFRSTNLVVRPDEAPSSIEPSALRDWLEARHLSRADFEAVMLIRLNPREQEGGRALLTARSIYVGDYRGWHVPLTARDWEGVAATAYHHEMAHLWGWEHDWSPRCSHADDAFAPFLADPQLFGWVDVDGDGVPEILDNTPYGRAR